MYYLYLPMMKQKKNIAGTAVGLIQDRIAALGISQAELAARCGEHGQTISAIIHRKRDIPLSLSIKMDIALGLTKGTLAKTQINEMVAKEIKRIDLQDMEKRKVAILEKIKSAGGLWSYQGIPEHLDDDSIIEAALVHLDLEDIPMLFNIWSRAHIKRVWKERLVSQGKRMNILNYILAVKVFNINHPDNYIARYA